MREILFRGKCIDETCLKGKWLEGQILHDGVTGKYYIHRDNCLNESDNIGEEGLLRFVAYEVDLETVCQYTGLTDKNGRKIFEGDIVGLYSEYRKEWDYGVVKYGEFNCSCCEGVYGWYFDDEDIRRYDEYEVKGNIFDNPELIGDQP